MKALKISFVALLAVLNALEATSASARSGHESNGGNLVKSNFISWARVIHSYIDDSAASVAMLSESQLQAFLTAIESTDVKPISGNEPFLDNRGRVVQARVVVDTTQGERELIELDQEYWITASPKDPGVCRLVLHEYLRVIGVDDDVDEDHNAVSFRWHDVCDFYVGDRTVNLGFESTSVAQQMPFGWWPVGQGGFDVVTDSSQKRSGQWSARISPKRMTTNGFGGVVQCVDAAPFRTRHFRLTGFLRLSNIWSGYAGLWARVDGPNASVMAFDNMSDRGLVGTRAWTPAIIDLPVADTALSVCFGALLVGSGVAWVDDFQVSVQ